MKERLIRALLISLVNELQKLNVNVISIVVTTPDTDYMLLNDGEVRNEGQS